jgi:hypothetical protein
MGHEFLGVVEETGSEVSGLRRGELVLAPFVWSDGTCDFCREGLPTSSNSVPPTWSRLVARKASRRYANSPAATGHTPCSNAWEPATSSKQPSRSPVTAAWNEFIPFLDYDVEIRTMICSTNAIESLNARCRRAVRARGHFPTEQAALKCLCLVTQSLDPTGAGGTRWTMRWKPVINAFAVTFSDT